LNLSTLQQDGNYLFFNLFLQAGILKATFGFFFKSGGNSRDFFFCLFYRLGQSGAFCGCNLGVFLVLLFFKNLFVFFNFF